MQKQKKTKPQANVQPKVTAKVKAPIAKTTLQRIPKPVFSMPKSSDGRVLVRHREYVTDILGTVGFGVTTYIVNPGTVTFPWLQLVAPNYESYRFQSLKFCFETTQATTKIGSVMMAVDYDPNDPAPINKTQLMAYHNAVRGPAWGEFCVVAAAQDLHKLNQKFVRSSGTAIIDPLLYDVGNLFVATSGMNNTDVVGELYVEYAVELMTPQTTPALSLASALVNTSGTYSSGNPFGSVQTVSGSNSLPVTFTSGGVFQVGLVGQYMLVLTWTASSGVSVGASFTTSATGSSTFDFVSSPNVFNGSNGTSASLILRINCVSVSDSFTLGGFGATNIVSGRMRFAPYLYALN